jgi:succinate-acetate transporter protein
MKERTLVGGLVSFLILGSLLATKSMDAIFVAVTIIFFLLCIAYAEGCGRL